MSHIEDKDEDRREEDTSRRLEVRFDLTGAGAAGAAGNPDADLTIWETPDPLRRALEMTGEFSKIMKNTLAKRLGEVGEQRFRGALAELQDALRTGKARNPGRLLIHILTEIKNGVHRP